MDYIVFFIVFLHLFSICGRSRSRSRMHSNINVSLLGQISCSVHIKSCFACAELPEELKAEDLSKNESLEAKE